MSESPITVTAEMHPFFKRFKPEYFSAFEDCAALEEFEEGSYLFNERQRANMQYLIIEGRVALEVQAPGQDPWTVMTVCDGGIAGFAWAYPPHRYYYSCRAVKKTRVVVLDAECLAAKCRSDHEFGYQVMVCCSEVMAERLMATRLQLLNMLLKAY